MIRSIALPIITLSLLSVSRFAVAGGALSGTIYYQGEVPPVKHEPISVDRDVCGETAQQDRLLVSKKGELKNAVVFLEGRISGGKQVEGGSGSQLDQRRCQFVPPVVIVPVGQTLKLLNTDHLTHHLVFNSRTNPPRTIAQSPQAVVSEVRWEAPEIFSVRCDVHPWMMAKIIVAENAYYTLTDEKGRFRLEDVPAGDYNLVVWHEALGRRVRHVQVREGDNQKVDVSWSLPIDTRYLAKSNYWGNTLTQ